MVIPYFLKVGEPRIHIRFLLLDFLKTCFIWLVGDKINIDLRCSIRKKGDSMEKEKINQPWDLFDGPDQSIR